MDTILSIVGLALGVASLVPAFTATDQKRKIIFVFVALALVGIFGYQISNVIGRRSRISALKNEMVEKLMVNRSMSFDQLLEQLYYPDFDYVDEAIDQLVAEKKVKHEVVDVRSNDGVIYKVRVYYVIPYVVR